MPLRITTSYFLYNEVNPSAIFMKLILHLSLIVYWSGNANINNSDFQYCVIIISRYWLNSLNFNLCGDFFWCSLRLNTGATVPLLRLLTIPFSFDHSIVVFLPGLLPVSISSSSSSSFVLSAHQFPEKLCFRVVPLHNIWFHLIWTPFCIFPYSFWSLFHTSSPGVRLCSSLALCLLS